MIYVKTPASKKILMDHLKQHDPEFLEFLSEAASAFGKMEAVGYIGVEQERLVRALKTAQKVHLGQIKEVLG